MFENKTHFPRFYRLVPIAEDFADGFVALVKRLNWHRVAVLSYDEDFVFNVKFLYCTCLYCAAQYPILYGHNIAIGILKLYRHNLHV